MTDLFGRKEPAAPLADALRPQSLDDVVGQRHLLGPGKPLRLAFESGKPHSMILWGPPGSGKTTLARLMAKAFDAEFIALSAVLSGVKDIREAVQQAEHTLASSGKRTILFVDEVHRFNKAQQDAFLPYVERGLITFVGATTENPSFEVNSALLSRAAVYVLEPLKEDELGSLLRKTPLKTDEAAAQRHVVDAVEPQRLADNGGNVDGSAVGKVVERGGVKIVGHANLPSRLAPATSALYARNLLNFLDLLIDRDSGRLVIDEDDELIKGTLITKDGKVVHPALQQNQAA